jgi:ribose 5-phosphate isomerase B
MKVFIASDHRGKDLKNSIYSYLKENNIEVLEIGLENNELDDYPDFAFKLCKLVRENENSLGILICGNGIGMSIAANKVKGIRCARVVDQDDAFKAKNHNDCNVIALGCTIDFDLVKEIVDTFISTKSASVERHLNRIQKIINYENGEYNEL